MEILKKKIELITTTAATTCDSGDCFRIIVDTTVSYNIKINLSKVEVDYGFFDAVDIDESELQQTTSAQN